MVVVQLWILQLKHVPEGQYTADDLPPHTPVRQQSLNIVYFQPSKQLPHGPPVPPLQHDSQYWPVVKPLAAQLVWLAHDAPAWYPPLQWLASAVADGAASSRASMREAPETIIATLPSRPMNERRLADLSCGCLSGRCVEGQCEAPGSADTDMSPYFVGGLIQIQTAVGSSGGDGGHVDGRM